MKSDNQSIVEANYLNRRVQDEKLNETFRKYEHKGINIINIETDNEQFHKRDAYYKTIQALTDKNINKAICLCGLRRTGKSTILNQIHTNAGDINLSYNDILHIELSATYNKERITRNELGVYDIGKNLDSDKIKYPLLSDLQQFIQEVRHHYNYKCILIDEITLCEDLILCGKGFVDWVTASGIKLVLSGTESASFKLAHEQSLYTRLHMIDTTYIPFGEYVRIKDLKICTLEEKQKALDEYMEHGNILDEDVNIDDEKYLEDAVGINLALSIINSDNPEFREYEHDKKSLTEDIIKYYRLIGDSISIKTVNGAITHYDISRAVNNINSRHKRENKQPLEVSKDESRKTAIRSAQKYFSKYKLDFEEKLKDTNMTEEQLSEVDRLFSEMGLLYALYQIPVKEGKVKQSLIMDDICVLHSLNYSMIKELSEEVDNIQGITNDNAVELKNNIISTACGRILENIITLQFIKELEQKSGDLKTRCITYGKSFIAERKYSGRGLCKYRNNIIIDGHKRTAEIDLIKDNLTLGTENNDRDDTVELIEIKKSQIIDEHQVQWLINSKVESQLRELISRTRRFERYVYYLGKDTDRIFQSNTGENIIVHYKNIVDILINNYNNNFNLIK